MTTLPSRLLPADRSLKVDRVLSSDSANSDKHKFIIVGDLHNNLPNTDSTSFVGIKDRTGPFIHPPSFSNRLDLLLETIREEKGTDFVVINGDIKHSYDYLDKNTLLNFEERFRREVNLPLFASYGNHDRLTNEEWTDVFGHGRSHYFSKGEYGFVILNSSDESGTRQICLDEHFLSDAFNNLKSKKGVFVFCHIPRYSGAGTGGADSPNCPGILDLFEQQENLISVTHSHFHEEYRIFERGSHDVWFTGHVAHYGINFYGYRVVEIDSNGEIKTWIKDITNDSIKSEKRYYV